MALLPKSKIGVSVGWQTKRGRRKVFEIPLILICTNFIMKQCKANHIGAYKTLCFFLQSNEDSKAAVQDSIDTALNNEENGNHVTGKHYFLTGEKDWTF